MSTSWKLVLLIVSFRSCVSSATHNYKPLRYKIPQPSIQAFRPKGFEVSIPHTEGIQLFAFQANINKPLDSAVHGQLGDDIRKKDGNRWVFKDTTSKLEAADKVYYKIFVVKDNLGYRLENGVYQITNDTLNHTIENHNVNAPTSVVVPDKDQNIRGCQGIVLNLTQNVLDLLEEINSLRETNDILKDMLEKQAATSSTLALDGVKVNDDDLFVIVQEIIHDKLHLPFEVRNVMRTKTGLVQFQVAGIREKVEVMKATRRELKHSKFTITY